MLTFVSPGLNSVVLRVCILIIVLWMKKSLDQQGQWSFDISVLSTSHRELCISLKK